MRVMIVSDIYGRTQALEELCKKIGSGVDVIDPYAGKFMDFKTEQHAYKFFMTKIGLKEYCGILKLKLEKSPKLDGLIGFSVGASAIWRISESLDTEKVKRVICFYGSQVRYSTDIEPGVVVEHVLPAHEPDFSVDELGDRLSGKKNVVLHKAKYLHGFMNKRSINYNDVGYAYYVDWLSGCIDQPSGYVE